MAKINEKMTAGDLQGGNTYIPEGIHTVAIESFELGTTDSGKAYGEFKVVSIDDPDKNDTARVWFTTPKGIKFSLRKIHGIASHNAKDPAAQTKVDDFFLNIEDTDELEKIAKNFKGYDAWFQVSKSGRFYTGSDGNEYESYDKEIYGYEPRPKTPVSDDTILDDIKKGSPVDADEIPFE